jgi:hypothetical protein
MNYRRVGWQICIKLEYLKRYINFIPLGYFLKRQKLNAHFSASGSTTLWFGKKWEDLILCSTWFQISSGAFSWRLSWFKQLIKRSSHVRRVHSLNARSRLYYLILSWRALATVRHPVNLTCEGASAYDMRLTQICEKHNLHMSNWDRMLLPLPQPALA